MEECPAFARVAALKWTALSTQENATARLLICKKKIFILHSCSSVVVWAGHFCFCQSTSIDCRLQRHGMQPPNAQHPAAGLCGFRFFTDGQGACARLNGSIPSTIRGPFLAAPAWRDGSRQPSQCLNVSKLQVIFLLVHCCHATRVTGHISNWTSANLADLAFASVWKNFPQISSRLLVPTNITRHLI